MSGLKKYGILAGIALALVAGGYATGRYAQPAKVVVTEKTVVVHDVQIVKEVDTDKVIAALQNIAIQQQKDVHKVKTTVKAKDGSVTTTVTTDDKSKTNTEEQTKVTETDKTKATEVVHDLKIQDHEITKTVTNARSDWRLSINTGFDMAALLHKSEPYSLLPFSSDLVKYTVLGLNVEHRIFGPVLGGVWANSHGMGGLTLTLEF
jgi:hypothetical protein